MRPTLALAVLATLLASTACGSKKPAQAADDTGMAPSSERPKNDTAIKPGDNKPGDGSGGGAGGDEGGEAKKPDAKKDECTGIDIGNLEETLNKVSCETGNPKPDDKVIEPKDKLVVVASTSTPKVTPGQHLDLVVTYTNKTKAPMTLLFRIDPTPRFDVEAYDAKNKRVDMPAGQPPPLPKGVSPREPGEPKTAKVTLAPGGNARVRVGWDAVKTKWAPEKVRGTPPEKGYPRAPAGPLPKGKYTLRVVTPLIGVLEGGEKEVSAPKVEVEVAK
jgi:hypothetical protein